MIIIDGKEHDLGGGMLVRRILPDRKKRMVGPFCFLDHMGPVAIAAKQNIDVRPHPHIGLSTLTYLLEGRMVHRDSLGKVATIEPGEVNWMTAGNGISHSERSHKDDFDKVRKMHGLQFWVALPDGKEDIDPSFQHYEANQIPKDENEVRSISLVVGESFGLKSPVIATSPMIFSFLKAKNDFSFDFSAPKFELALYVVSGSANFDGETINQYQMAVFEPGKFPKINVRAGTEVALVGGEPFETPRFIWWNLVSSSKEKIELAKQRWKTGQFPMVPGDTEFIPLPE